MTEERIAKAKQDIAELGEMLLKCIVEDRQSYTIDLQRAVFEWCPDPVFRCVMPGPTETITIKLGARGSLRD